MWNDSRGQAKPHLPLSVSALRCCVGIQRLAPSATPLVLKDSPGCLGFAAYPLLLRRVHYLRVVTRDSLLKIMASSTSNYSRRYCANRRWLRVASSGTSQQSATLKGLQSIVKLLKSARHCCCLTLKPNVAVLLSEKLCPELTHYRPDQARPALRSYHFSA